MVSRAESVCVDRSSVFSTFLLEFCVNWKPPLLVSSFLLLLLYSSHAHHPRNLFCANVSAHSVRTLVGFTSQLPHYQDFCRGSERRFNAQRCKQASQNNEEIQWVQTISHFSPCLEQCEAGALLTKWLLHRATTWTYTLMLYINIHTFSLEIIWNNNRNA